MSVLLGNPEKHVSVEIGLSEKTEIWSFELHVFGDNGPTVVNWDVEVAEEELSAGKVPDKVAQELGAWLATEGGHLSRSHQMAPGAKMDPHAAGKTDDCTTRRGVDPWGEPPSPCNHQSFYRFRSEFHNGQCPRRM